MKTKRLDFELLRIIAIFLVVFNHTEHRGFSLYLLEGGSLVNDAASLFLAIVCKIAVPLFLLVSGICVTLGSHPVKRGIIVFLCGLLCTAVTGGMYLLGMSGRAIIIWFGVLHCLGVCMLLWPLTKKLPTWALGALGLILVLVGLGIRDVRLETDILAPLGLYSRHFFSSDYFPLLPNLGWFLLGAVLGRTVYRKKETLLPRVNPRNVLVRILCWCGNKSLLIYLLHQPVLAGVFELVLLLRQ